MCPTDDLGGCGKFAPTGMGSTDRQVRSESLQCLSHPDPRLVLVPEEDTSHEGQNYHYNYNYIGVNTTCRLEIFQAFQQVTYRPEHENYCLQLYKLNEIRNTRLFTCLQDRLFYL